MAKERGGERGKTTRFKKGTTGNPSGRPTVPKEIRELKKVTAEGFAEMASTLLYATDEQIVALLKDPGAPMLKKIVARILEKTIETGSMAQMDQLLNRLIGKVQDHVKHTITRPSILVRRDGSEVVFTNKPVSEEE